jgi:predicted deacylase
VTAAYEPFEIHGVVRLTGRHDAECSAPRVAIIGSIHGNEPCGLRAIERLTKELTANELQLDHGTLYLVHGNPHATQLRERHTPDGVDLNRLFDYRFETSLPSSLWAYEHYRALELRPLLETVDVLLDLHSTTAPAPAFGIVSPLAESRALAAALGLGYITEGWDGPGLLADRVVSAPLTRRGQPAVSVECGQHADAGAVDVAYRCIRRALDYLGLLPTLDRADSDACTRLRLNAAVKRPSAGFRFVQPLTSMQQLPAGALIGRDQDLALTVNRQCYVIMPNDTVPVGEDMIYIAQPVE